MPGHLSGSSLLKGPKDRQEAPPACALRIWEAAALESCETDAGAPALPCEQPG